MTVESKENNLKIISQSKIEISEKQKKQTETSEIETTFFVKFTFIILGISSLIGWNSVLSSFPYFNSTYGPKVYTWFPIPLNISNCLFGLTMPYLATKTSNLFRIACCQILQLCILVSLPIIDELCDPDTGYTITLILTFFIGMCQSIGQNSMIAMAAQIGGIVNSLFWISTGLSGLVMAILSIICFLVYPHDEHGSFISTILFMSIGAVLCLLSVILTYILIVNKKFLEKLEEQNQKNTEINNQQDFNNNNIQEDDNLTQITDYQQIDNSEIQQLNMSELKSTLVIKQNDDQNISFLSKVKEALTYCRYIPFMIFIIYILTFTLFPAIMQSDVQFTTEFLNKDDQLWGQMYLNLTYQISDVLGKSLSSFPIFHKKPLMYTIALVRIVIFVPTSLLVAYQKGSIFNTNWFPFINMFLMAFTNGFSTGGLMSLNSQSGKGILRVQEILGFIGAFGLTFGILCGTFLAYVIDPQTEIYIYYNNKI